MKRFIISIFIIFISFSVFAEVKEIDELFEIKTDVKVCYPIFDNHDSLKNSSSVATEYEIRVNFPIINSFGVCVSGNILGFSFEDGFNKKFAKWVNYSVFTGVFYNFELKNNWYICPNLQAGFSYGNCKFNDSNIVDYNTFAVQFSVDFIKRFATNWTIYGTTSIAWLDYIYPISAGVGLSYIVE